MYCFYVAIAAFEGNKSCIFSLDNARFLPLLEVCGKSNADSLPRIKWINYHFWIPKKDKIIGLAVAHPSIYQMVRVTIFFSYKFLIKILLSSFRDICNTNSILNKCIRSPSDWKTILLYVGEMISMVHIKAQIIFKGHLN